MKDIIRKLGILEKALWIIAVLLFLLGIAIGVYFL